jgi:hypothetical protein
MNDIFEFLFCPQHGILIKALPFIGLSVPVVLAKYHKLRSLFRSKSQEKQA